MHSMSYSAWVSLESTSSADFEAERGLCGVNDAAVCKETGLDRWMIHIV